MNFEARTILLVEDNDDDVFIFRRAYKQAQLVHPLQVVNDGQEAYEYLTGEGRFKDRAQYPMPFLVLLDLKLPLRHGFEVLQAARHNPQTAELPVVILTSSAEQRDVTRAHELGAHAFLVKPPAARTLLEVVAAVRERLEGTSAAAPLPIAGDLFGGEKMAAGAVRSDRRE